MLVALALLQTAASARAQAPPLVDDTVEVALPSGASDPLAAAALPAGLDWRRTPSGAFSGASGIAELQESEGEPNGWAVVTLSTVTFGVAGYVYSKIVENAFGGDGRTIRVVSFVVGMANGIGYCLYYGCDW